MIKMIKMIDHSPKRIRGFVNHFLFWLINQIINHDNGIHGLLIIG